MTTPKLGDEFNLDQNTLIQTQAEKIAALTNSLTIQEAAFAQLKQMYNQRVEEKDACEVRIDSLVAELASFNHLKETLTESGTSFDEFLHQVEVATHKKSSKSPTTEG